MALSGTRVVMDSGALAQLLRGSNGPVYREMLVAGEIVRQGARRRVGVHKPDPWGRPTSRRPGTLRDSIVKRIIQTSQGPGVEVGSDDPVALLHHEGTPPHSIEPRSKPRLVFWTGGAAVYALHVDHPGTRPNKFLTDALQDLRRRYN